MIPNNLRAHRKRAGLRQLDVALLLVLRSTNRICRWEKGLTFPHMVNLLKLSIIYKATMDDLYGDLRKLISEKMAQPSSSDVPFLDPISLPESVAGEPDTESVPTF
jgi:transcriptional regulator with XRE-family HTH domain